MPQMRPKDDTICLNWKKMGYFRINGHGGFLVQIGKHLRECLASAKYEAADPYSFFLGFRT